MAFERRSETACWISRMGQMVERRLSEPNQGRRSPLRRGKLTALVAAVLLVPAAFYGARSLLGRPAQSADNPPPLQGPAPRAFRPSRAQWASLKVGTVQTMAFDNVLVTDGNIAYDEDRVSPVYSPYSGRVTRVIAKMGDIVRKGAPLMTVEASELAQGQSDLSGARSALDTAQAQARLAQATEKRQHELYLAKAGALKDWLQSQADLTAARNNLRAAEAALAAARNRLRILGKPDAEINGLERPPAEQAKSAQAVVTAPISGTVTQRQVGLGQYITSVAAGASNSVYTVSDLSTVWLIANVRETDAPFLRLGQPVEVRVPAFPGRSFKASIAWIAPALDPSTHRLPVRAEVRNPHGELKPMMFASFRIAAGTPVSAPAVPEGAIVYEGEEARVFVVNQDGTIAGRSILLGHSQNGMIEVKGGLRPGERIITAGALFVDRATELD